MSGCIEIILDSRGDHLPQDLEALCFGGVVVFLDMHGKTLVDVDIQWHNVSLILSITFFQL